MGDRESKCEEVTDPSTYGRRDENVEFYVIYVNIQDINRKECEIQVQNGTYKQQVHWW